MNTDQSLTKLSALNQLDFTVNVDAIRCQKAHSLALGSLLFHLLSNSALSPWQKIVGLRLMMLATSPGWSVARLCLVAFSLLHAVNAAPIRSPDAENRLATRSQWPRRHTSGSVQLA